VRDVSSADRAKPGTLNDVDPLTWLAQTLQRIANGWPSSQIEKLMPWNYKA
jgi:transposase